MRVCVCVYVRGTCAQDRTGGQRRCGGGYRRRFKAGYSQGVPGNLVDEDFVEWRNQAESQNVDVQTATWKNVMDIHTTELTGYAFNKVGPCHDRAMTAP